MLLAVVFNYVLVSVASESYEISPFQNEQDVLYVNAQMGTKRQHGGETTVTGSMSQMKHCTETHLKSKTAGQQLYKNESCN